MNLKAQRAKSHLVSSADTAPSTPSLSRVSSLVPPSGNPDNPNNLDDITKCTLYVYTYILIYPLILSMYI